MLEKNPGLLEKISVEMQAEIKKGKSQTAAAMAVFPKYQKELQEVMGDKFPGRQGPTTGFNPNGTIRK
jgi:hypothetical protein